MTDDLEEAYRRAGRLRVELEAANGLRRELRTVLGLPKKASDAAIIQRVRSIAGAELIEEEKRDG